MLFERLADHDPALLAAGAPRQRLWKVRAHQVILATGAIERPIAFANNDRPGVMLASAARAMVERYGVAPGSSGVVFTNNDDAYQTALVLKSAGVLRAGRRLAGPRRGRAACQGARGRHRGRCQLRHLGGEHQLWRPRHRRASRWRPIARARAGSSRRRRSTAISSPCRAAGIRRCISGATTAARSASTMRSRPSGPTAIMTPFTPWAPPTAPSRSTPSWPKPMRRARRPRSRHCPGPSCRSSSRPQPCRPMQSPLEPLWFAPATGKYNEGNKHFIDFQNDVTAADLELAQREGYESVEHTKRYTTFGMATDQGKTSNINGLGVLSEATGKTDPRDRHHHLPAALHALLLRLGGRNAHQAALPADPPDADLPVACRPRRAFRAGGPMAPRLYLSRRGRRQAGRDQARNPLCAEQGRPARCLHPRQDRDQGAGRRRIPRPHVHQHVLDAEGRQVPLRPDDERAGLPHRRRRHGAPRRGPLPHAHHLGRRRPYRGLAGGMAADRVDPLQGLRHSRHRAVGAIRHRRSQGARRAGQARPHPSTFRTRPCRTCPSSRASSARYPVRLFRISFSGELSYEVATPVEPRPRIVERDCRRGCRVRARALWHRGAPRAARREGLHRHRRRDRRHHHAHRRRARRSGVEEEGRLHRQALAGTVLSQGPEPQATGGPAHRRPERGPARRRLCGARR